MLQSNRVFNDTDIIIRVKRRDLRFLAHLVGLCVL